MSSSVQLEAWAAKHRIPGFLGVFAADALPRSVPQQPWSLIVNYEGHTEPGDHWVACIGSHGRVLWCSSYGFPPDEPADMLLGDKTHFKSWLRSIAPHGWQYQRYGMQSFSPSSDACGEYALWFCKSRGGPAQNPAAWFFVSKRNRDKNDMTIKKMVTF